MSCYLDNIISKTNIYTFVINNHLIFEYDKYNNNTELKLRIYLYIRNLTVQLIFLFDHFFNMNIVSYFK